MIELDKKYPIYGLAKHKVINCKYDCQFFVNCDIVNVPFPLPTYFSRLFSPSNFELLKITSHVGRKLN